MELVIASMNQGKIVELRDILAPYFDKIYSLNDLNINIDIEETGGTFQENAKIKAVEISKATGKFVIADDSGLVVDALGGAPGIFSARYYKKGDDEGNINKLLQNMENILDDKRTARFVCAICLAYPNEKKFIETTGVVEGKILREKKGNMGFGYDPVFYYEALEKTFGEISEEQKNSFSHRKKAIDNLIEIMKSKHDLN